MTPKRWISLVLIIIMFMGFAPIGQAQTEKSVKRGVATVFFATLGGAVLGLSTLSFYGDPQEHTENISMGALVGAIAGAGYLAYDSSKGRDKAYEYSKTRGEEIYKKKAPTSSAGAPFVVSFNFDF